MTLFPKNRGTPTLSLKGGVCVPLFLFVLVLSQLITPALYAQDLRNRTEEMYHLGTVIISKEPLPDKVYQSQKDKVLISVMFLEKETTDVMKSSVGTGFLTKTPGVIVTARHLLDGPLADMKKTGLDYDYMFMGTIITDKAWINFSLFLEAIGEKGTLKDMMALRTDPVTMERARIPGDVFNPNPYAILLRTSKFADADVGDNVYITGFGPTVAEYFSKNDEPVPVYSDLINHTFSAEIEASIIDMPGNKVGIKKLYRLRDSAEPGFSGGKVVNEQGEIVGMTIAMTLSKNFVYVISSKDIEQFLKDHKLK